MTIPFLGKRIIYPTKKDLQTLLLCSDIDHPPSLTEMEPETLSQLNALDTGSVAFIYEEKQTGINNSTFVYMCNIRDWINKKYIH